MEKKNRPKKTKLQTAKKTAAVLALMTSPSIKAAAKAAGVSRATLFLWLKNESFRADLTRARAETFADAIGTLKAGTKEAAHVLMELLKSKKEMTRFRASSAVLEMILRIHEGEEIEERLRRLEDIAAGGPGYKENVLRYEIDTHKFLPSKFGDPDMKERA